MKIAIIVNIVDSCCEPWIALVEFGVDFLGFSHVVGYWHELGGCGILYYRVVTPRFTLINCTLTIS